MGTAQSYELHRPLLRKGRLRPEFCAIKNRGHFASRSRCYWAVISISQSAHLMFTALVALALTARKIFSRYPAVRLVLTVSFILLSSLSKFQSLIRGGLKISFRPRLPKKPRVNCVKKPWNKIIPYKFYAAKVLDSISTGLKIPEGQTKKTGAQHIVSSLHTCFRNKKDCLFSKSVVRLWYSLKGKRKTP